MNEYWKKLKGYIFLITYAILLYLCVSNISQVLAVLSKILRVLSPFILGILFAYIFNILMSFLEHIAFNKLEKSKKPFIRKLKRPLSILSTFLIVFAFLTIVMLFLVPQLSESVSTLTSSMKDFIPSLERFINDTAESFNLTGEFWKGIVFNWNEIITRTSEFISAALPEVLKFTLGLTNGIVNLLMSLIISVYFLATKEKLIRTLKKLIYAFTSRNASARIIETGSQANVTFQHFIAGQATEALILGVLVLIGMLIFNFPYAVLCSVILGLTNMIPIFGPWIGAIPSAFIILMAQPSKALWFIVFIVILQQLENNLIYPRVVGSSIGIDGLWVLFAIVVGGSLFGLAGMLLGIPTFAVLYTIIRKVTNKKLKEKDVTVI